MSQMKPHCANCGKRSGYLIRHDGKWWCPGACVVPQKGISSPLTLSDAAKLNLE